LERRSFDGYFTKTMSNAFDHAFVGGASFAELCLVIHAQLAWGFHHNSALSASLFIGVAASAFASCLAARHVLARLLDSHFAPPVGGSLPALALSFRTFSKETWVVPMYLAARQER